MRFSGNTVVITGGSGGIGLATALRFAKEGATVVIIARDEGRLAVAERLIGGNGIAIAVDVTKCR